MKLEHKNRSKTMIRMKKEELMQTEDSKEKIYQPCLSEMRKRACLE